MLPSSRNAATLRPVPLALCTRHLQGGYRWALQPAFYALRSLFPPCRLDQVGFPVGVRLLELCSYRERQIKRKPEILDILRFIHSVAWPYMFGKAADDLQQANAAADEYMITDQDLLVNKYISVPKSYGSFNPGAVAAGMVRGMLDAAGFPARVSAHFVESGSRQAKAQTTILIKFDASVMQRQAYLDNLKKGGG